MDSINFRFGNEARRLPGDRDRQSANFMLSKDGLANLGFTGEPQIDLAMMTYWRGALGNHHLHTPEDVAFSLMQMHNHVVAGGEIVPDRRLVFSFRDGM